MMRQTIDLLEGYKKFIKETALENILTQYLGRRVFLSPNLEENCKLKDTNKQLIKLKSFLEKHEIIQEKIYELARKAAYDEQQVNRISLIGKGLTSDTFHFDSENKKQIKQDFIDYLYEKKKLFEIWSKNKKDSGISEVTRRLMESVVAHNKLTPDIFYKHANLEVLIKDLIHEGLTAESPMLIKIGERYWSGHSDLIFQKGDTIYIADYKPNYDLGDNPGEHFVNAFPQLIAYALTIATQIDKGLKVKCIAFNNEAAVEFDPVKMFDPIKKFLEGDFDYTNSPLKDKYHKEWTTKEIYEEFIADFEHVIEILIKKGYILNT
ncbi:MAG: hypothetical protein P8Y97_21435 [Candidatus Lokiarchaeota archaeon]